ncbi:hypothetical protein H5410_062809 [Solanum commersonii]|uniref:Uncharacterized protein n=1 Tax=Solanum commersonii TaxID=4109 RepID=A0A9J5WBF1_SOLCO|nr:hypothetical protein H5410_062809 [Solanum commersonii]
MKGINQEQEGSTKEDPYPSLFSEEMDKFHSHLTETGCNNINTSDNLIYDYEDSYLNNNNTKNPENLKLQLFDKKKLTSSDFKKPL